MFRLPWQTDFVTAAAMLFKTILLRCLFAHARHSFHTVRLCRFTSSRLSQTPAVLLFSTAKTGWLLASLPGHTQRIEQNQRQSQGNTPFKVESSEQQNDFGQQNGAGVADEVGQHLKTLGLKPGATASEVKQAYRELATVWHPDRYAHAPQSRAAAQVKMAAINEAYQYLKTHGTGQVRNSFPASSTPSSASQPSSSSASGTTDRPRYNAPPTARATPPPSPAPDIFDVPLMRAAHILRVSFAASQPVTGLAISPDSSLILAATGSMAVWWDAQTGHQVQGIAADKGSIDAVAVAVGARYLVFANNLTGWMGGPRCELRVCDLRTGHERQRIKVPGHVTSLDFSPDGKQFAAGDAHGIVRIWEAESARPVQTLTGSEEAGSIRRAAYVNGSQAAKQIITLKAGKVLNEIALWEIRRARLLREYSLHVRECLRYGQVADIAPSPDGRLLLVANNDPANRNYSLHVWNMQTGNEVIGQMQVEAGKNAAGNANANVPSPLVMRGHTDNITCMAWAADGLSIVSGSEDKTVRAWDAQTGQEMMRGIGHTRTARAVAVAPDGSFVASGGGDGTVRVWKPSA